MLQLSLDFIIICPKCLRTLIEIVALLSDSVGTFSKGMGGALTPTLLGSLHLVPLFACLIGPSPFSLGDLCHVDPHCWTIR